MRTEDGRRTPTARSHLYVPGDRPERLAERAERAREASRAHSQDIGRDRGPRQIEGPER